MSKLLKRKNSVDCVKPEAKQIKIDGQSSCSDQVWRVLELDAKYRTPGVNEGLITMKDIMQFKCWDFSMPTICYSKSSETSFITAEKAIKRLCKTFPFLDDIDWNNVLLAGGSVSAFIAPNPRSFSDLDFFIYGLEVKIV